MRLTLRNLLRFLDQTDLRSIERSRLEELVEESEKAEAWIQRIDSLRHGTSVKPPELRSQDPSISRVAAYLDSEMGETETIDFERSMLSSDNLLAEVAGCHEVRELLRTDQRPAVPILLRQSAYDIGRGLANSEYPELDSDGDSGDENSAEEDVASIAASMQDLPFVDGSPADRKSGDGKSDKSLEMDDPVSLDKLSKKAKKKSWVVTILLLMIVAGLLGLTYELGRRAGKFPQSMDKFGPVIQDDNARIGDLDGETDKNLVDAGESKGEQGKQVKPDEEQTVPDRNVVEQLPRPPLPDLDIPVNNDDENQLPQRPWLDPVRLVESETAEPLAPREEIAKLVDPASSLWIHDVEKDTWIKTASDAALLEVSDFMVIAGSTVALDFNSMLSVEVEGPARFSLARRDKASGASVIQVDFGRFTVKPTMEDVDLLFDTETRRYRLTMPLSESTAVVNFFNHLLPGDDPRTVKPSKIEVFTVRSGRVSLHEGDQTWLLSTPNSMARCDSNVEAFARPPVVGFVQDPESEKRYVARLQQIVEKNLPDLLNNQTEFVQQLVNLKGDHRQEIRFAAMSWLASVGNYSYLVDFLNEDNNRSNWRSLLEAVRASVVHQPEFAAILFDDLAVAGEENQKILFDLLSGISPDELESGDDELLVQLLDDDNLGVRVVAIETIRYITGGLTYGYTPFAERKARRRIIERQWQKALRKKEIRYAVPPTVPFPDFSTVPEGNLEAEQGSGEETEISDGKV